MGVLFFAANRGVVNAVTRRRPFPTAVASVLVFVPPLGLRSALGLSVEILMGSRGGRRGFARSRSPSPDTVLKRKEGNVGNLVVSNYRQGDTRERLRLPAASSQGPKLCFGLL